MKLENPKITILVNREYTEIEIHDTKSSTTFVKVRLTPEQLSSALSRLSHTECEVEVTDMDRINKKHEWQSFEFEIVENIPKEAKGYLNQTCLKALKKAGMEEWQSDNYFTSQNSFFTKDGKNYARVTVRRWI